MERGASGRHERVGRGCPQPERAREPLDVVLHVLVARVFGQRLAQGVEGRVGVATPLLVGLGQLAEDGLLLEGVTRDSILTMAGELGLTPVARPVTLAEIFERIDSGDIVEAFACGTAAVLTPVAEFRSHQGNHVIGDEPGERTMQIRSAILDVQYGRADDVHGWLRRVV